MKTNYPLLIIDDSRKHCRGLETDYIVCTSSTCGFIAHTELYNKKEFPTAYEAIKNNKLCTFLPPNENGVGLIIYIDRLFNENISDGDLRRMKERVLKEYIKRSQREINYVEPSDKEILDYLEKIIKASEEAYINETDKSDKAFLSFQVNVWKKIYFKLLNKEL